jgi:diadenosine tetraphosphate (Ap4A) HIT family hydrolase
VATIFTRIIEGELPGTFVHRDERAVAFMSINPIHAGHTLVVPVEEVDHWTDASPELLAHLVALAQRIAAAQRAAFSPARVALIVAGFEVPHLHLHVIPADTMADVDFANAARSVDPAELEEAAARIRVAL